MLGRPSSLELLDVLNDLADILKSNTKKDFIYLENMKTFNTAPHECLLHKVSRYGIKHPLLSWIKSFLTQ